MSIIKLIKVLYRIKVLTPIGLLRLITAIIKHGINIMVLLQFAAKTYGEKIALVDDREELTYSKLLSDSEMLANVLWEKYQIKKGNKVGILCKNQTLLVKAIFSVSRLGADVYLLNTEMSQSQLRKITSKHHFDLLVYDLVFDEMIYAKETDIKYHENSNEMNTLSTIKNVKLKRTSMSKLLLLTGGTTGTSKSVAHKPSLFHYLHPFMTFITKLKLLHYKTAYIATPIYHGYGLAVLFIFLVLGKKVVITKKFNAEFACQLIHHHQVEIVTIVPVMVDKMLKHQPEKLKSLCCIASGGAELNPKIVEEVFYKLGPILYNLYGTTEVGTNIIATPEDLIYSSKTIGRKIDGVRLKVLDQNKRQVNDGTIGQLCMKNSWSMVHRKRAWIETGDLGYRDSNGYYFLSGRVDDMVVSGGVNVYPIELEQIMIQHPKVEDVAVIGIKDDEFGERLLAFVVNEKSLSKEELKEWLRTTVARYQIPKEIIFLENMPYTSVGKIDKKKLRQKSLNLIH